MITETRVEALMGVALVHQSVLQSAATRVYLQVVLIFRWVDSCLTKKVKNLNDGDDAFAYTYEANNWEIQ